MNTETTIAKNIRTADDKANYDLMTAIMICLGRPEDKDYAGVLKLLYEPDQGVIKLNGKDIRSYDYID